MIDENLSWNEHISSIAKKISSGLGDLLDNKIRALLFIGDLLRPIFTIAQ